MVVDYSVECKLVESNGSYKVTIPKSMIGSGFTKVRRYANKSKNRVILEFV